MINKLNIQTFIKLFPQNFFKPTKTDKENFFISSCSILFTVTVLIFINLLIYLFYPDNSEALRIEMEKIISPLYHRRIAPEPIEQLQILTSLILIPLLIISSIKIFSSKLFSRISVADFIYFFNLALCFSFLGILFYFSFNIDDPNIESIPLNFDHANAGHQAIRRYFSIITSNLMFIVAIIIYPLITYFIIKGIPKKYDKFVNILLYSFIGIILLSLFLLFIFNRDNYIGTAVHLNAVLYSISQVQQGKTLLVDLTNQYGLYPEFLYPIFKLINVNIISFSIAMAALTTISYSLILLGLRKIIKNNLVTFLAFIAIIYFGYIAFFIAPSPINNLSFDIYHAYKPIRIIFPALILYSVFTYILTPKRNLYLLITFISSVSILWNFDSGVICFLSFYIYILYERLIGNNVRGFTKDFIKHTFISFGILALTILLFSSYIYFSSYNLPDWSLFLEIPAIFGSAYFFSLPMQLFNAWNLIFLIYLYGIYIGFNSILLGKKDSIDKIVFFVAIFGLGISTYYLNRSHDLNLLQTLYPSLILLAIFLDKLLAKNKRADLFKIKNFSIVMLISFVLVVTLFQTLQPNKMINALSSRIPDIINNKQTNQLASDGVVLVNFNASPNDRVVIISDIDTAIHLETKTASPFSSPGSSLNRTQKDWNILMNSLINNKSYKVFISGNVYRFGKTPDSRLIEILKIFDEHYYLDDWLGDWRMFIPKEYKPVNASKINALASYSEFCPNNSVGCNKTVINFNTIENFPTNDKFIKIDFNLSKPITLQNIMVHVITDGNYSGSLTTLPIQELGNIGILDNEHKKFINTNERLNKLDYKVEQKLSVLVPENNYMTTCAVFKVELIYNNNKKINVHVPCQSGRLSTD
tara:strand:- start:199 stop:2808 length:2610 start_codon:yes stop_codon:yes gene_type:complete